MTISEISFLLLLSLSYCRDQPDRDWTYDQRRAVRRDVQEVVSQLPRTAKDAEVLLGLPFRRVSRRDRHSHAWLYSRYRGGPDCVNGFDKGPLYHVQYVILELEFGKSGTVCRTTEQSFIGPDRRPNPFSRSVFPSVRRSCDDFLRSQAD
jgi:hypothetical protein